MAKRNKVKKDKPLPSTPSSGITPTIVKTPLQGVSFSLKYFQSDHQKFSPAGRESTYLIALLERLRDVSSWNAKDLMNSRSKTLRCHPIDWDDTTEKCFGIPGEEEIINIPYQFSLSSNEHGRIHGFFINEIFYIVWLDPDHQLYRSKV